VKEFRDKARKLGEAAQPSTQQPVIDALTSLLVVLEKLTKDVADLKIRQGKLGTEAAEQAAETTKFLIEGVEHQVETLATEVRDLRERVVGLEARELGAPPKEGLS
jgi:hypothetical protein